MSELIKIVLAKPEWSVKMKDPVIFQKWREEIVAQGISVPVFECVLELLNSYDRTLNTTYDGEDTFNWDVDLGVTIAELDWKCECHCTCCEDGDNYASGEDRSDDDDLDDDQKKRREIKCECTDSKRIALFQRYLDKFVFSKTFEDADLKRTFTSEVASFEKSLLSIDYHPGSDNLVIDIVHPSLYPYIKGVSIVEDNLDIPLTDAIFQWLPSEFAIDRTSPKMVAHAKSYINNIPPCSSGKETLLEESIGKILGMFVPEFDRLLRKLHDSEKLMSPTGPPAPLSHCQVIVKLANIVIPPATHDGGRSEGESGGDGVGTFPGGHWHLEGMAPERIVATGIYYYDMTNIQTNSLAFRSTIGDVYEIPYEQGCSLGVQRHFGLTAIDPVINTYGDLTQSTLDLGHVNTVEDMMLVFPNFLQHKVSDMKLVDPTREGTRKILCFFLINPYEKVMSTAHVSPQQNKVTLEDAKLYRELLMFQRKYQIDDQTRFFERGWSLCEH